MLRIIARSLYVNPTKVGSRSRLRLISLPAKVSLQMLASAVGKTPQEVKKFPVFNQKSLSKTEAETLALLSQCRPYFESLPEPKPRPPVVTIMGHVDHGKTSILDFYLKSKLAEGEAGGITQKISAFNVRVGNQQIAFIDTPGHQTFKNMRSRGASATDLVILVVSALQGPQNQTLEVIDIVKECGLPVVVAISKIDMEGARAEEVERQIYEKGGLHLEEFGGNVPVVHVSSKTGKNMDLLLELVLEEAGKLGLAELVDFPADGIVIESRREHQSRLISGIVLRGTLKPGAFVVMGHTYFKVKRLMDQVQLASATPSQAVEIEGSKVLPEPGTLFFQVENENRAKLISSLSTKIQTEDSKAKQAPVVQAPKIKLKNWIEKRKFYKGMTDIWTAKYQEIERDLEGRLERAKKDGDQEVTRKAQVQLENHRKFMADVVAKGNFKEKVLNLIVKAKEKGMLEVLLEEVNRAVEKAQAQGVLIKILRQDVGELMEADLQEALDTDAVVLGMDLEGDPELFQEARDLGVKIVSSKVIYTIEEDLVRLVALKKNKGMLQVNRGTCSVAEVFRVSNGREKIRAAGVRVDSGRIGKKLLFEVEREGKVVANGLIVTMMKRFKKEVQELQRGEECTLIFQDYEGYEKGDLLRCYELTKPE